MKIEGEREIQDRKGFPFSGWDRRREQQYYRASIRDIEC